MATQYVPTERIIIRPETQGVYEPGAGGRRMIKFFIPPSVGYMDTVDLVLRSTITMSGAGNARPNPRAGIGSLFRSLSIRSGTNNALIEHIDSYNGLCAATLDYTANESITNLRALTEGVDKGSPGVDTAAYNSIYYTPARSDTGAVVADRGRKVMTEYPFHHSGILSGGRTFPVAATGGLRVELELDEADRSLMPYGNPGWPDARIENEMEIANKFDTNNPEVDVNTKFVPSALVGLGGPRIGDTVTLDTGSGTTLDVEVTAISIDASKKLVLTCKNNSPTATTYTVAANTQVKFKTLGATTYQLEDLALVLNKVSPPEGYNKSLMQKASSANGLTIDFPTWSLIRNTLPTQDGVLSQNIPTVHPEAYSILSVPYNSAKYKTFEDDTFAPDFSGAVSYQYFIDGEAVPNRSVPLARLAQTPPIPEALHLREMTKALENAGVPVRNLIQCQTRSLIGRALSVQGQVADLSNGDTRLQTEYSGSGTTKQFDHHVCFCAQMNISDSVVEVRR